MNYRHGFHAGNHADVLKHAVFARAIWHLKKKDKPFAVLDAHSGSGLYDLRGLQAVKTGEWQTGIGLMREEFSSDVEVVLAPFRDVVKSVHGRYGAAFYPGSPLIAEQLLRKEDRLIINDLHPEEAANVESRVSGLVEVYRKPALHVLKSLLPFKERRGLILYDPPYEIADESALAVKAISEALKRFATGVYLVWYPVKGASFSEDLLASFKALKVPNMLQAELRIKESYEGGGLAGSGLIIINPPFGLVEELELLLPALAQRLGIGDWGRGQVQWLTPPK